MATYDVEAFRSLLQHCRGDILTACPGVLATRRGVAFTGSMPQYLAWLQICIRWGIQHGTSVIPKATSKDHILGNLDVLDWELKPEDYEVLLAPAHLHLSSIYILLTGYKVKL